MNSCHKVVRSIKSTTLKLCGDLAKQFVKNVQNCGKTNHDNAPAYTSMLMREFSVKNKTIIMPYSPDFTSADFFLLPKLNTVTIEEMKKKKNRSC